MLRDLPPASGREVQVGPLVGEEAHDLEVPRRRSREDGSSTLHVRLVHVNALAREQHLDDGTVTEPGRVEQRGRPGPAVLAERRMLAGFLHSLVDVVTGLQQLVDGSPVFPIHGGNERKPALRKRLRLRGRGSHVAGGMHGGEAASLSFEPRGGVRQSRSGCTRCDGRTRRGCPQLLSPLLFTSHGPGSFW